MYKPIICFTILTFGVGAVGEALDKADVPYVFGDDGFVAMSSTGTASPANAFIAQNMISGEEMYAPPPRAPWYVVGGSRTDPTSGSTT